MPSNAPVAEQGFRRQLWQDRAPRSRVFCPYIQTDSLAEQGFLDTLDTQTVRAGQGFLDTLDTPTVLARQGFLDTLDTQTVLARQGFLDTVLAEQGFLDTLIFWQGRAPCTHGHNRGGAGLPACILVGLYTGHYSR